VAIAQQGFQLGVPQLEVEHRQIHRRAERITAAVVAGNDAEVRAGFVFLAHYLEEHFAAEERWMEEEGYPGLLDHARIHAGLLARLGDARRALELVGAAARAVKEIVKDLQHHLDHDDQKLVRFHAAKESLRRMACRAGTGGVDAAPAGTPSGPLR
jgi:hemerythrin